MSILIKGMGMPKRCLDCPCFDHDYAECQVRVTATRENGCPLVEIPTPHGRLIDADELCDNLLSKWDTADEQGQKIISEVMARVVTPIVVGAPTVIEADEGEDD